MRDSITQNMLYRATLIDQIAMELSIYLGPHIEMYNNPWVAYSMASDASKSVIIPKQVFDMITLPAYYIVTYPEPESCELRVNMELLAETMLGDLDFHYDVIPPSKREGFYNAISNNIGKE